MVKLKLCLFCVFIIWNGCFCNVKSVCVMFLFLYLIFLIILFGLKIVNYFDRVLVVLLYFLLVNIKVGIIVCFFFEKDIC